MNNFIQENNIQYISQQNNLIKGNFYKFVLVSQNKNISELLPSVKTTSSKVYDYALGESKEIPSKHICLPIWYDLEESISDKVVNELSVKK